MPVLRLLLCSRQLILTRDAIMEQVIEPASRIWRSVPERTESNRLSLGKIKSIPPEVAATFFAIDWFSSVNQFRNEELAFLSEDGAFAAAVDSHRATVAELISQGEALVLAIKQHGMVSDVPFGIDDIRATIDSLRETFRGVHGPHNHPETNKAITALLESA